ncbi:MAG TPA: trypsin-like peptidase domain-containing protein [Sphingopyxis sp.]|uniref:trypsin-like peptidase domain-containing protein n=1 Tax=Sphingopyxis sp. TaxID=1908224 RepID=UPI002B885E5D|nr:trypsin-like peptidase domain-containing protein [Sphingopyxis sp.]HWW59647.1 trypsin-like peptidase domain-containing protein [Sphingopyxis sp.]
MIHNKTQLSQLIGVPVAYLNGRAFVEPQASLYSIKNLRKRNGSDRTIYAPYWPLKNIQSKILLLLSDVYRPSNRVNGFVKGRGIRENARPHVGKRIILNLDIKDFFESINFGRVRGRLMAPPYLFSNEIATTVARLCTIDGVLPTGAPTSPILSNMICSKLDYELTKLGRKYGCFYTRYADDITFSTNGRRMPIGLATIVAGKVVLGSEISDIITGNGFKPNLDKTRLLFEFDRQEVCGVTCNEKLNVRRPFLRDLRGMLHAWRKFGREKAEAVWREKYNFRGAQRFEASVKGKIQHLIHIRGPRDRVVSAVVEQYNEMPDRQLKQILYEAYVSPESEIERGVCVIECGDEESLEWSQGSGFVIPGGRILTNAHVITFKPEGCSPKIFSEIRVKFPPNIDFQFDMTVSEIDMDKDIAVIELADKSLIGMLEIRELKLSFGEVSRGDSVFVAGYPSYSDGDAVSISSANVTGFSKKFGNRFFKISSMVVHGNSGGPVLDNENSVIGIATLGGAPDDPNQALLNGCIPMHRVQDFLSL